MLVLVALVIDRLLKSDDVDTEEDSEAPVTFGSISSYRHLGKVDGRRRKTLTSIMGLRMMKMMAVEMILKMIG